MWTAKETIRALRGQRAAILRNWQAEAQERLWHLDRRLFTRRGAALECAGATLNALIDFYQDAPVGQPTGFLSGLGVQNRPEPAPRRDESGPSDAAARDSPPADVSTASPAVRSAPAGTAVRPP